MLAAVGNLYCYGLAGGFVQQRIAVGLLEEQRPEEFYVPDKGFEKANKSKFTIAEVRTLSADAREPLRNKMREKLMSEKGREIYMKGQGLVEPTHGDDQKNRGWIQHHLRGLDKATAEFTLIRIAANLGKIIKYRPDEMLAWRPT